MFSDDNTIIAPLTPPGQGAVTILRLSGNQSLEFLSQCFVNKKRNSFSSFDSHRLYYGFILSDDIFIDEVMAVYMAAPRSYTCEDVVEIHCHASVAITKTIIDLFVSLGARIAHPGEFTYRAFKNGRIDLSHAEAVADLIASKSSIASQLAMRQMTGALSNRVYSFKDSLLRMLALVEAYIDFPEDDIEISHAQLLKKDSASLQNDFDQLLSGYDEGRILRDGFSLLILGKPNVGKSSLLNLLVGEDRAIVTNIPGTTRDIIQESITLKGFPLTIVDTAGIRDSDDPIEQDGVLRAKSKIKFADIILYLIDGTCSFDSSILEDLSMLPQGRFIIAVNKLDKNDFQLSKELQQYPNFSISVKFNLGISELIEGIFDMLNIHQEFRDESVILSDRRHRDILVRCKSYLDDFIHAFDSGESDEFLALHLREALQALGEITGETTPDDILNDIFSRFCIGK